MAAALQPSAVPGAVPLTAVFVYRSETAYAAVLGVYGESWIRAPEPDVPNTSKAADAGDPVLPNSKSN
jgi:hypothetical protein